MHIKRIVTGKTHRGYRSELMPEGQPATGAGDLFAKKQQEPPFKIENIGRKNADNNQGHPKCCFVIHAAYWPVLSKRTSLVSSYGELHQKRFDLGNDVFRCNAEMRIKLVNRGGGTKAGHSDKRGLLRIAAFAR